MKFFFGLIGFLALVSFRASAGLPPTEDCTFTMNGQPYVRTTMTYTGPDAFTNFVTFIPVDGSSPFKVSAKPATPQNDEILRFKLDKRASNYEALAYIHPQLFDQVLRATLFYGTQEGPASIPGTCTFVSH